MSQFPTLQDMEMYGETCSSPILYMLLEYLNKCLPETHEAKVGLEMAKLTPLDLDHTASHLGKALGILHFLKQSSYHATLNQCYLPAEILSKYHLSQESMIRPLEDQEEAFGSVIHDIASIAVAHLGKVKKELLDKMILTTCPMKKNPFTLLYLPYVSLEKKTFDFSF